MKHCRSSDQRIYIIYASMVATNRDIDRGGEDVGKLLGVQFTSGRLGDACETGHKSLHSASMSSSTVR